jgi:serine/threonine-protein kinase
VIECARCHTPLPENSRYCFSCGADTSGGSLDPVTSGQTETLLARLQRVVGGKYAVREMVGRGGMGAVFVAHDLALEREVAIKVLPPDVSIDDYVVRRFQQEAKTAAKLDHPNIIPIYRVESEGGLNYFIMKYVAGQSLEEVLDKQHTLPLDYIQRVLWEAACALGHAHQRGVVHRDVKPANIMFDQEGRVMLTDFGISKALQAASGFTGTGMIVGTPHYMAPEQAKGAPVDGRADQYSLGIVGYRMIAGELPFSGDSIHTILYKHIFEEPPPVVSKGADIPEFLSAAIARALGKAPEQRFPTMEEFATAVWPEQPIAAPPARTSTAPSGARPRTSSRPRISGAVSDVASAPTAAMPATRGRRRTSPAAPRRSRAALFATIAVLAVVAAGAAIVLKGGGTLPAALPLGSGPAVVDLQVAPPSLDIPVGGRDSLSATPFDRTGRLVPGTAIVWSSNNPTVATVDSTGIVTGVAPGVAVIRATAGTQRDDAAVQVFDDRPAPSVAAPAPATGGARREPVRVRPQPQPAPAQGYLSIAAEPYATVFIDGAGIGETPIISHPVRPGRHTIRVERPGYRTVTETVQVDAGNTVQRRYPLIQENP